MSILNKIVLTITLLLLAATAFTQVQEPLEYKHYLAKKSVTQKRVGIGFLVAGAGMAIAGGIIQHKADQDLVGFEFDFTGAWIAIAGGGVGLTGLITLALSSANRKRAARL
jgi:hypothetical protein